MTKETEPKDVSYVTFEGKDYDFDKLNEEAQYYIKQIATLQEEMAEMQAAVERSKMAFEGYQTLLRTELSKD